MVEDRKKVEKPALDAASAEVLALHCNKALQDHGDPDTAGMLYLTIAIALLSHNRLPMQIQTVVEDTLPRSHVVLNRLVSRANQQAK